jgi:hypothetical protein
VADPDPLTAACACACATLQVLEVSSTADNRAVRQAYDRLVEELGPVASDSVIGAQRRAQNLKAVERAFDTLSDPDERADWEGRRQAVLAADEQALRQRLGRESHASEAANRAAAQRRQQEERRQALQEVDPRIQQLTSGNYDALSAPTPLPTAAAGAAAGAAGGQEHAAWLVEFTMSQCTGCDELKPVWKQLAAALPGVAPYASGAKSALVPVQPRPGSVGSNGDATGNGGAAGAAGAAGAGEGEGSGGGGGGDAPDEAAMFAREASAGDAFRLRAATVNCETDMDLCLRFGVPRVPFVKLLLPLVQHDESYHGPEIESCAEHAVECRANAENFARLGVALAAGTTGTTTSPATGTSSTGTDTETAGAGAAGGGGEEGGAGGEGGLELTARARVATVGSAAEFQRLVRGSDQAWVVLFSHLSDPRGAQDCPQCGAAHALLRHMSARLHSGAAGASVARIDCAPSAHESLRALCEEHRATLRWEGETERTGPPRLPMVRVFPRGEKAPAAVGEALLPRAFASESEVHSTLVVMETALRMCAEDDEDDEDDVGEGEGKGEGGEDGAGEEGAGGGGGEEGEGGEGAGAEDESADSAGGGTEDERSRKTGAGSDSAGGAEGAGGSDDSSAGGGQDDDKSKQQKQPPAPPAPPAPPKRPPPPPPPPPKKRYVEVADHADSKPAIAGG